LFLLHSASFPKQHNYNYLSSIQVNLALAVAAANSMPTDQDGAVGCDPVIDLSRFKPEDFPTEDCDELARLERAREMREGVEPPPGSQSTNFASLI